VPFTYSCTDNVGTPSCVGTLTSGSPIDTSTSGVYQLSVTSTDGAGNTSQRWVTYSVARPTVSVADVTVVEGPGATLDFVVSLSNPSSRTITVEYDTADGTAVDPTDYSGVAGSLEFLPGGATSQTVQVPVADDNELRPDRSMSFTLSDAINALIDDGDATGTIVDDDPPELSLSNAFAIEGPGAALTFTVTLDQDPNFPVAVEYATQDGTAVAPDRYQAATGTLTFNPGEALSQQVVIPVVNDSIYNAGASSNNVQTMTLTAGIPSRGISLTGTGSIIDDETRPPVLSIGSLELREGDERNRPVKLWVSLNAPATQLITVQYTTMAGSATVGDFKAKTGTLTFKPGIIMKPVPLVLTGDTAVEGDEAFTVQLSSPVNAIVNDGVGEVSILDDDSPSAATVEATISDAKVYEGGGVRKRVSISFTVSLSKRPTAPVSISYSTSSGVGPDGAISTIDFLNKVGTLNFTPMQVAKVVTVSVFADSALEVDETFSVNLLSATGPVTITDATGTGTILNDD
jgi:hypothetical protein